MNTCCLPSSNSPTGSPGLLQRRPEPTRTRWTKAIDAELGRRPRVSGPGAAPGEIRITQRLGRLFDTAGAEAGRLKDEYVSVEHLLLALIGEGVATPAGRVLRDQGLTREAFLARARQRPGKPAGHLRHAGSRLRGVGEVRP